MNQDRQQLFNDWAARYDSSVSDGTFPFVGYNEILQTVFNFADIQPGMKILDVGTGTGNLARLFLNTNCSVFASDFSVEMLSRAAAKSPGITFIQHDLQKTWPVALAGPFDRIVSAYVLHEFELKKKAELIRQFGKCLTPEGKIIIGDIAFETAPIRAAAAQCWADMWDQDEFYWAADETITLFEKMGMAVSYTQISICGGIFVIMPTQRH